MGADKTYQDYGFYADELNRFEANVITSTEVLLIVRLETGKLFMIISHLSTGGS